MTKSRTDRLNSLLKHVISDVIHQEVENPDITIFVTVTHVSITKDLRHAKVYVSLIGTQEEKEKTLAALQATSGFIGSMASKQVVMRFFPSLTFILDDSVDKQMRIDSIIKQIHDEEDKRKYPEPS